MINFLGFKSQIRRIGCERGGRLWVVGWEGCGLLKGEEGWAVKVIW